MNARGFSGLIVPLFDARRGQVYTGAFRTKDWAELSVVAEERLVLLRDWLASLKEQAGNERVLFMGEDLRIHRETIAEQLGEQALLRLQPTIIRELPTSVLLLWASSQRVVIRTKWFPNTCSWQRPKPSGWPKTPHAG